MDYSVILIVSVITGFRYGESTVCGFTYRIRMDVTAPGVTWDHVWTFMKCGRDAPAWPVPDY
jgi:hypothetical protein